MTTKRPARAKKDAPIGAQAAAGVPLQVACFGDSVMWGQGLVRTSRFSVLAADQLAALHNTVANIAYDRSRSGAKSFVYGTDIEDFIGRFPALFQSKYDPIMFRADPSQQLATNLYGEIPANCPSVAAQIAGLDPALGQKIDIAFLDGGMNDLDVETVLNPKYHPGGFASRYLTQIQTAAYHYVYDLLERLRSKCPKALIFYFGSYLSASYDSDTGHIRDAMQYQFNNDLKWYINEIIHETDVNFLIVDFLARAQWLHGNFQYYAQQAVDWANHNEPAGSPGIVFVPASFGDAHAALTGATYIWDDFTDPVSDPARAMRLQRDPRENLYPQLKQAAESGPFVGAHVASLKAMPDLPRFVTEALAAYDGSHATSHAVLTALGREVDRIHTVHIASLGHPNTAGAAHWAQQAVDRYKRHIADRDALQQQTRGATGETFDQLLKRTALRTGSPVEADLGRLNVDAVTVQLLTAENSDHLLAADLFLVVVTRASQQQATVEHTFRVTWKYEVLSMPGAAIIHKSGGQLEPGSEDNLRVATDGLRLTDIVSTHLVMSADPIAGQGVVGKTWRPARIGLEVFDRLVSEIRFNNSPEYTGPESIDLKWPAPNRSFVTPQLLTTRMAPAPPLQLALPKALKTTNLVRSEAGATKTAAKRATPNTLTAPEKTSTKRA